MNMEKCVKIISIEPLKESIYLKPKKVHYKECGVTKNWDIVEVHDSVAVIVYDRGLDSLLLVKQLRPAVLLKNGDGHTYELCAGIADKNINSLELAIEEVEEELGFSLKPHMIKKITEFYTSVGFAGSKQELFYAEVNDNLRTSKGGGVGIENIETVYLKRCEIEDFMFDSSKVKTPGLMFALTLFANNHPSLTL